MNSAPITSADSAKAFALAGAARLTLVSQKTGTRFTYKVAKAKKGDIFFVSVLRGQDNNGDYTYIGIINPGLMFAHGKKSEIGIEAPSVKAFAWAWNHLGKGELPPSCEVWHEGRCGHCARPLTTPESIASGFGPVCAGR